MEPSPPDSGTSAPALHDGQGENASSGQKTTLAVQLPCGVGLLFKGEAYHFQGVNPSHCSVYWVLRWVMDFLGGNKSRNAVGQSAQTWRSRISDVLQCAHDEEQAAAHLLSSSWASLKRSDAAPDTAVAVDCLDFCVTTPGLLALLSHWAVRGPRANATWTLPTEEFMARCKALVAGVMGHMLYGEHSQPERDFPIIARNGEVSTEKLFSKKAGSSLRKICEKKLMPLSDILFDLIETSSNRNYSSNKRAAADACLAQLLRFVGESTSEPGLRSISGALSSQEKFSGPADGKKVRSSGRCPAQFALAERFAYLTESQGQFKDCDVLGLVADGVHVGDEDWLNCFLYHGEKDIVTVQTSMTKVTVDMWECAWHGRMETFWQGHSSESRLQRARGKQRQQPQRMPTYAWLRDLNHAMLVSAGKRLRDFACPQEGEPPQKRLRALWLCSDQESTQVAGCAFLSHHRQLMLVHVPDPAHRSHNDVTLSLSSSGLLRQAIWNLALYNVKYGPWAKSGFYHKVTETATLLSTELDPDDPLLVTFFPHILQDRGMGEDQNNREQRQAFLAGLPSEPFVTQKGIKASISRFNSLVQSHAALDEHWSAQNFLFCSICILQGWITDAAELWGPDVPTAAALDSIELSKARAKTAVKAQMNEERKGGRAVNTLHLMTRFMSSQDNKSLARLISYVLAPEAKACGTMLHEMRSAEDTLRYFSGWAHWAWLKTAKEHVGLLSDVRLLARIGFELSMEGAQAADSHKVSFDQALCKVLLRLLKAILRFRAGSQLWNTNGAGCSAGLLHSDEEKRRGSLSLLRTVAQTIKAVQQRGSKAARELLRGHDATSPAMRWILDCLSQVDYASVPEDLRRFLLSGWGSLLNSKLVEDANKIQREMEQRHVTSKRVSASEGWHALTRHELVASYKRQEIKAASLKHVPPSFQMESLFSSRRGRSDSATPDDEADDAFAKAVTGHATWPTHTPESQQERYGDFALLLVETAWRTALLPEGEVVRIGGHPACMFVVRTYKRSALLWPMLQEEGNIVTFDVAITCLFWTHIFRLEEAEVLPLTPWSPLKMSQAGNRRNRGVCLVTGAPQSLLQYHVEHGFAGVSEAVLRKLNSCSAWGEPQAVRGVPEDYAHAMWAMLNHDPSLTGSEAVDRILQRVALDTLATGPVDDEVAEVVRDTMPLPEQKKILEEVDASKKRQQTAVNVRDMARKAYGLAFKSLPAAKLAAGAAARKKKEAAEKASAKAAAKSAARVYAKMDSSADDLLRAGLPDGCGAYADHFNGRWRLSYDSGAASCARSVSWTLVGARAAAAIALRQAWAWAEQYNGLSMSDIGKQALRRLEA
ncbi:unnamed protein product [Effrenium voratum]|nr:unnamed protein product [Effrenium voratum]